MTRDKVKLFIIVFAVLVTLSALLVTAEAQSVYYWLREGAFFRYRVGAFDKSLHKLSDCTVEVKVGGSTFEYKCDELVLEWRVLKVYNNGSMLVEVSLYPLNGSKAAVRLSNMILVDTRRLYMYVRLTRLRFLPSVGEGLTFLGEFPFLLRPNEIPVYSKKLKLFSILSCSLTLLALDKDRSVAEGLERLERLAYTLSGRSLNVRLGVNLGDYILLNLCPYFTVGAFSVSMGVGNVVLKRLEWSGGLPGLLERVGKEFSLGCSMYTLEHGFIILHPPPPPEVYRPVVATTLVKQMDRLAWFDSSFSVKSFEQCLNLSTVVKHYRDLPRLYNVYVLNASIAGTRVNLTWFVYDNGVPFCLRCDPDVSFALYDVSSGVLVAAGFERLTPITLLFLNDTFVDRGMSIKFYTARPRPWNTMYVIELVETNVPLERVYFGASPHPRTSIDALSLALAALLGVLTVTAALAIRVLGR